ncbi:MAG: hypothetical protein Q8P67_09270, partial [archaeon]|nr:hypothetical protein [archaeon]
FLSHLHGDHTTGLRHGWELGPLYLSQVTAALLADRFDIREDLLRPLPLGERTVLPLGSGLTFAVTLLPAHHCPGAVMFLLEGYWGRFLHTGDFRLHRDMLDPLAQGCGALLYDQIGLLDRLYLDNTYCSPAHRFPDQLSARELVFSLLDRLFLTAGASVLLGTDSLGKEDLLLAIARRYSTRIVVSPERAAVISLCAPDLDLSPSLPSLADCFSPLPSSSPAPPASHGTPYIRVMPKRAVPRQQLSRQLVGVLPTSFQFAPSHGPNLHYVPYSLHSSYDELLAFVAHLRPRSVVPIVSRTFADMSCFLRFLSPSPPSRFVVPLSLRTLQNPSSRPLLPFPLPPFSLSRARSLLPNRPAQRGLRLIDSTPSPPPKQPPSSSSSSSSSPAFHHPRQLPPLSLCDLALNSSVDSSDSPSSKAIDSGLGAHSDTEMIPVVLVDEPLTSSPPAPFATARKRLRAFAQENQPSARRQGSYQLSSRKSATARMRLQSAVEASGRSGQGM